MPNGDKHNYWLTPDEVMLPEERKEAGAKAVSHNLPGFNKEKISAALMAQGASYVRFYNTDGLLRYRPDDAYFANKSVYAARLNGKEVNVTADLTGEISGRAVGDVVTLSVARSGQILTLEVTLGDRNAAAGVQGGSSPSGGQKFEIPGFGGQGRG